MNGVEYFNLVNQACKRFYVGTNQSQWICQTQVPIYLPGPPEFHARKVAKEEPLFPLSFMDEIKLRKGNPDDELNSATYYMKKKLGRMPRPGEYVIQISSRKDDVRIVRTRSEQKQWGTNLTDCGLTLFHKYKPILDPDGIHAKIVLDPTSLLVAICSNCGKYIELDDVKEKGKDYFCCQACKNQFNHMKKYPDSVINQVKKISQMSQSRIRQLESDLGVRFA